jgi:hypothetical protein
VLSVVVLNVVMLSIAAPLGKHHKVELLKMKLFSKKYFFGGGQVQLLLKHLGIVIKFSL